jgi:hypothetical protein
MNCSNEDDCTFFSEAFPCHHCEEQNVVEYNMCPGCGLMWRSIEGNVIEGSVVPVNDFNDFASFLAGDSMAISPDTLPPESLEFLKEINDHFDKLDRIKEGKAFMSDYINKCIRCDSTAVDIFGNVYKCTGCGFSWEVFD